MIPLVRYKENEFLCIYIVEIQISGLAVVDSGSWDDQHGSVWRRVVLPLRGLSEQPNLIMGWVCKLLSYLIRVRKATTLDPGVRRDDGSC